MYPTNNTTTTDTTNTTLAALIQGMLSLSIPKLQGYLQQNHIPSETLEALIASEKEGKNRKGALALLRKKLEEFPGINPIINDRESYGLDCINMEKNREGAEWILTTAAKLEDEGKDLVKGARYWGDLEDPTIKHLSRYTFIPLATTGFIYLLNKGVDEWEGKSCRELWFSKVSNEEAHKLIEQIEEDEWEHDPGRPIYEAMGLTFEMEEADGNRIIDPNQKLLERLRSKGETTNTEPKEDVMTKKVKRKVAEFQKMEAMGGFGAEMLGDVKTMYIEMAHGDPLDPDFDGVFFQEVCLQMGWMTPAEIDQLPSAQISGKPDSEGETLNTTEAGEVPTVFINNHKGDEPTKSKEDNMTENQKKSIQAKLLELTELAYTNPKEFERRMSKALEGYEPPSKTEVDKTLTVVKETVETEMFAPTEVKPVIPDLPTNDEALAEEVNDEGWTLTKAEMSKILRHEAREAARQANYRESKSFCLYGNENYSRTKMVSSTALVGLLNHLTETGAIGDKDEVLPAVIHILNERFDDNGRKMKIDERWRANAVKPHPVAHSMVMVKESHLINAKLIRVLAHTFPKAAEFRAYISGLCAPGTYTGEVEVHFREFKSPQMRVNDKFELVPVKDGNGDYRWVCVNPDGNGIIHPQHWLLKKLRFGEEGGTMQKRFWGHELGLFLKGIFVVDESAVIDGKPAIIANKSFVKGRMKKAELKKMYKLPGTVINVWNRPHTKDLSRWSFEQLQQFQVNEKTMEAINDSINRWMLNFDLAGGMDRYIKKACNEDPLIAFQVQLCRTMGHDPLAVKSVATVAYTHAAKDFYTLLQGAGIKSPTYTIYQTDAMPEYVEKDGVMYPAIAIDQETQIETAQVTVKANAKGGIPSWKEFVSNTRDMSEEWLAAHPGAGNLNGRVTRWSIKRWKKVLAKLNRNNPEAKYDEKGNLLLTVGSTLIVKQIDDVYLPGDIILVTRYPLVTQQNLCYAIVVKPSKTDGVLKATGRLAARTFRMHGNMVAYFLMGDSDGDRAIAEGRERILKGFSPDNKIINVHGGNEVLYMLEPSKLDAEKDPTANIRMKKIVQRMWDGVMKELEVINPQALRLIGWDGGGPVGQLTYMNAMFMQLAEGCRQEENFSGEMHFLRSALAMAIMVQEAIDRMKRTTPYTSPDYAYNPKNWKTEGGNIYALDKVDERFCEAKWYKGQNTRNDLNMKVVREWAYEKVEMVYPELKAMRDERTGRRTWGVKDIMGWRKVTTDNDKKLDPRKWVHHPPIVGEGNLVNYCAAAAYNAWQAANWSLTPEELDIDKMVGGIRKALEEKGHNLNWDVIGKKEADVLRRRLGLSDYNDSMNKVRDLAYEDRADARRAAHSALSSKMAAASIQDVVTAIVMEVEKTMPEDQEMTQMERLKALKEHADRVINNVTRLASTPGNPISIALGFEEGGPCRFMEEKMGEIQVKRGKKVTKETLTRGRKVAKYILAQTQKRRATGEAVTEYQLAMELTGRLTMPPKMEDEWAAKGFFFDTNRDFSEMGIEKEAAVSTHFKATGTKIHKCRHCCDTVDRELRRLLTDDKKMANRQKVTTRIGVLNGTQKLINGVWQFAKK